MLFQFWRAFSTSVRALKKSPSSKRWLNRQNNDAFTRLAKTDSFRSRAAYKLLELHKRFNLFRPGMTVVDLGYAPGSWSQVAVKHVRPKGRVFGVDMLFVTPPDGVTAIQGNFLNPAVQARLKQMLADPTHGQPVPFHHNVAFVSQDEADAVRKIREKEQLEAHLYALERIQEHGEADPETPVDLVLSDMLANTSGLIARDHSASVDLCDAALLFCIECLRPGGSFVCKFYTGDEDQALQKRLQAVFKTVRRAKPTACRPESREAYFVALNKRKNVVKSDVFPDLQ
ncbi:rRNA methyltransferase 2, mitochondrial [Wickerhamiella sorbophila]|uniref:rRNA methyltransferase 2, mitochondrial n=1 Tax=Wickerhamiella sorbophila TaxID=45607 RepID=A0A2T0FGL7_9ASCO|nr:rRNA methyltransferase 2, mitochondrial [Wickerhamiella sorbophila]PRT54143.1 rRNA methyltransferase 2, mitochondrial [Wickerhamiella sorbophila]